jgi:hypothetical protein
MELVRPFHPFRIATLAAAAALLVLASTASAQAPRSPQVGFSAGSLSSYLISQGQAIDVAADQVNAQVWTSNLTGHAVFTLKVELAGNAAQNTMGIYNTDDSNPTLYQVFPGLASAGWYANVDFGEYGALTVRLYDRDGHFQGQTIYAGVNRYSFGFYLTGPNQIGTFYSQDSRNGGNAQVLTYKGTGKKAGGWWQCFEDLAYVPPGQPDSGLTDFQDAVMFVKAVDPLPVPASGTTWGALKALYGR